MSGGVEAPEKLDQAIMQLQQTLLTLQSLKSTQESVCPSSEDVPENQSGPNATGKETEQTEETAWTFSSNEPLTGECAVCAKGPLDWVERLRDLEVTSGQRTKEWFAARKQCVTASELASVLSQNPYCSRVMTLKKKCGLVGDTSSSTFACQHGNDNEDRAIQIYERKTGHKVMSFGLLRSQVPGQTHIAGSPDGVTHCGRLVEVKCPVSRTIIPGDVPKHYLSQIELLMHIGKIGVADFVQMGTNQGAFDITACPRTEGYYESVKAKIDKFVEMLKEVRADKTTITKYERKRKSSPKKVDISNTFEAGFILDD